VKMFEVTVAWKLELDGKQVAAGESIGRNHEVAKLQAMVDCVVWLEPEITKMQAASPDREPQKHD